MALMLVSPAQAKGREASMAVPPADTVRCATRLDRAAGAKRAAGMIVACTIPMDSAGTFTIMSQLYQDRRRGPVAFANQRGQDISRSALGMGSPVVVHAARRGPVRVELWFPGSELRRRAHAGDAWVDIQVQGHDASIPRSRADLAAHAPRWYRCRVAGLDPAVFVDRLPGQDLPRALPKAVSR
jgi:hypothetical protein